MKRYLAGVALFSHHFNSAGAQTSVDKQFMYKDALDSVVLITDSVGTVKQQSAYNAWGERVNTSDWQTVLPSTTFLPVSQQFTTRSYTGQEAMDAVGLINYGGRIYDSKIARFVQADPIVQNAQDLQAYNRYAYVRNNPLTLTDPSGFSWISKSRKKAHKWRDESHKFSPTYHTTSDSTEKLLFPTHDRVSSTFGVVRGIDNYLVGHQWAQAVVTGVATYFGGAIGAAAVSAHITHAAGGSIDDVMRAGIVAGASAMAFSAIGAYYGNTWSVGRVGWTAAAGGATAEASGGRFVDGFKMSGATALFSYGAYQVGQMMAAGNSSTGSSIITTDGYIICDGNTGGCVPIGSELKTYDYKAFTLNPDLGQTIVDFEKITTWPYRTFSPQGRLADTLYGAGKAYYDAVWGGKSAESLGFVYGWAYGAGFEAAAKNMPGIGPLSAIVGQGQEAIGTEFFKQYMSQ